MLRIEPLESRRLLSRYALTDLGDFHGRAMNDWGLVAGLDVAGHPATWYQGQITELATPDGFLNAVPNAVNGWGQVAGYGTLPGGTTDALFWDGLGVVDLGPGRVDALNDLDQMAGESNNRAAVWSPYRPVEVFGGPSSEAFALNDAGQATGNDPPHAFRWQDGELDELPYPDPTDGGGTGYAIDGRGDMAGFTNHRSGVNEAAVWWADGSVSTLGILPDFHGSTADGVNDRGQVVGRMQGNLISNSHAFIWDSAHGMRDLNDLTPDRGDVVISGAGAVNDRGLILASSSQGSVLLTPAKDQDAAWLGWAIALQGHCQATPVSFTVQVIGLEATGTPSTSQFPVEAPLGMEMV